MNKKIKMLLMTVFMVFALSLAVQIKAEAVSGTGKLTYLSSTTAGISLTSDNHYKDVQLLNYKGKPVKTVQCISYASFDLSKNKVYYFRWRYNDSLDNLHGNWSKKVGFSTCVLKMPSSVKSMKIPVKAPKIKGAKKIFVTVSTKYRSGIGYGGWSKVKTLKPGKKANIKRFKGKKLKFYTYYYVRPLVKGKYGKCTCPTSGSFYFRKVYR